MQGCCRGRGENRRSQGSVARRKQAEVAARQEGRGAATFLPVQVVMDQPCDLNSGVEIHWDNGRSVWLRRRFDRQTLAEVLAVLEVRPC